jgi:hypothetical protein
VNQPDDARGDKRERSEPDADPRQRETDPQLASAGQVALTGDEITSRLSSECQSERGRHDAADHRSRDHGRDAEREHGRGLGGHQVGRAGAPVCWLLASAAVTTSVMP